MKENSRNVNGAAVTNVNIFSETAKRATKEFEAEVTVVKSHSDFWSMGSDNCDIKERGKAVKDDFLKIIIAELAKRLKSSRKKLMQKALRMRTSKSSSRKDSNCGVKQPADM